MKKLVLLGSLFLILIHQGCEDETDTNPPNVSITFPLESSVVSEVTTVQCVAVDNDSVSTVELWIDSLATGVRDSSPPYEFLWNTVPLQDSTEHSIMVMAEDMSNNISMSSSISVFVDNSNSNPQSVNIRSITYTETEMTITIDLSMDEDFLNYKILQSESLTSEKHPLIELLNINDTIVHLDDFNPVQPSWYWVEVEDIHGYKAVGDGYFILDEPPGGSYLRAIDFFDTTFTISWTPSIDYDFQSYSVFESMNTDMTDAIKVFETDNVSITTFNHQIDENQYRYYQLFVEDHWELEAESNVQMGCSWFLFENTYGDASYDYGRSLIQTNDGGYLIVGNTSLLGDSYSNVLLVKIDHRGDQQWKKDYTFSSIDRLHSAKELLDGSLIMAGFSMSNTNSSKDLLVVKTDSQGNIEWQRTYGDLQDEIANSIDVSSDGNFIIVGEMINANTGYSLCYLLNIDSEGALNWSRTFGGSQNDYGYSVVSTNDAGFVVTGLTRSQGDNNGDAWLIKVDSEGEVQWERTYGGEGTESGRSVQQTDDGGYIIIGQTDSFGSGYNDAYLLKTDSQGNETWSQTFGGIGTDQGRHVVQTYDQGYAISGYTDSFGELGGFNFWLIKTGISGDLEWQRYYGDSGDDRGLCGIQATDGGYAVTGYTNVGGSNAPDILLIKTDDIGNTDQIQ